MPFLLGLKIQDLFSGILLRYLAHSLSVAESPTLAFEQSWDGCNYNMILGHTRGTITVIDGVVAGAFRNERSSRIGEYPGFSANGLFSDAPQAIRDIAATDTLEYLYDHMDGATMPVATTAFWSEGDDLLSCDTEEDFCEQGGDLIMGFAAPAQEIYEDVREEYELGDEQIKGLDLLTKSKGGLLFKPFAISSSELFRMVGENPKGILECIRALKDINIEVLP
ncbi:MAG: hypothetical protein LBG81_01700 [Coriobacteriaceae bacterium]|jgi:hypothetical protein|nr:hypothetical protein [Coriobacteriaceae bacterium]